MLNEILSILLIPLLFGVFETNSFQNTFCNIQIFGLSDLLQCDQLKDTLILKGGENVDISMDNSTDTITIDSPSVRIITVQTDPWFVSNTNVEYNQVYFVSDGSITFNVTSSYP